MFVFFSSIFFGLMHEVLKNVKRRMDNTERHFEGFLSSAFKHTTRGIVLLIQLELLLVSLDLGAIDGISTRLGGGVRAVATETLDFFLRLLTFTKCRISSIQLCTFTLLRAQSLQVNFVSEPCP